MKSTLLPTDLDNNSFSIDSKPVRFRFLKVNDIGLWTDFVNGCSKQSLWMRLMSPFSATPEKALRFCDINPEMELAIIAEMIDGTQSMVIAIARLIKTPQNNDNEAELAIIVSDQWQKKTLGRMLAELSIGLAKQWGVKNVFSETLMENHAMIKVLKRCQFKVEERRGNMFTLSLKLG